jgi:hypothetical protein
MQNQLDMMLKQTVAQAEWHTGLIAVTTYASNTDRECSLDRPFAHLESLFTQ